MSTKFLILSLFITIFVTACTSFDTYTTTQPDISQKAISLEMINSQLTIPQVNVNGLSALQSQAVSYFILDQGDVYKQRILVKASQKTLEQHSDELSVLLQSNGVSLAKLNFKASDKIAINDIEIMSEYFVAVAPTCIKSVEVDFGCATSRNLASLVADPVHLIRGVGLSAAEGNVSVNGVVRYRKGNQKEKTMSLSDIAKGL